MWLVVAFEGNVDTLASQDLRSNSIKREESASWLTSLLANSFAIELIRLRDCSKEVVDLSLLIDWWTEEENLEIPV